MYEQKESEKQRELADEHQRNEMKQKHVEKVIRDKVLGDILLMIGLGIIVILEVIAIIL